MSSTTVGRVPEMPAVELDAERGTVGVLEELDGLGKGRDHRPVLPADAVDRLQTDTHTCTRGFVPDRPQSFDDGVAIVARSRQANDAAGLERGEPVERRADRLDPLLRLLRAFHQRQRQDRRHRRNRGGRAEPTRLELLERLRVAAGRELDLPHADPVHAGSGVGADVGRERRCQGRDLRDRETRPDAGDSMPVPAAQTRRAARRAAAPPAAATEPSRPGFRSRRRGPGPGHVLAPMWKRPSTAVRWPGWRANGRQRKFWSSASEPEYGSPRSRLMFAFWRSAGDSTTRRRIEDSRFGTCFERSAPGSGPRSARAETRPSCRPRRRAPLPRRLSRATAIPAAGSRGCPCLPARASRRSSSGCPTTTVASVGSKPRSASLTARETPSSPGVRWTIAVLSRRSSPSQRGGSDNAKWICMSQRPKRKRLPACGDLRPERRPASSSRP